ncbi:hypothetical protein SPONL_2220 [uncultured Candidatus Thioglobus sp.]|nr:hypothetical protein SPONL_2220 [uncultured Candidatus Thioglobus sp.]
MIITGAIITSLLNGHKDMAMEIIKAAIFLSAGALGGWGASKRKAIETDAGE